jgi:hypothetical protein
MTPADKIMINFTEKLRSSSRSAGGYVAKVNLGPPLPKLGPPLPKIGAAVAKTLRYKNEMTKIFFLSVYSFFRRF